MTQCLNCRTFLDGSFCPNCGQKDVDLERPAHQLVGEVLRESFDLDGRAFRTIRALFGHPGYLTSEFLAGRRSSYTSPIRLYLLISVAFFVLIAWLAGEGVLLMPEAGLEIDAASQAQFMSDQLPLLLFVYLLSYFVISMHRVYHASWIVTTVKSMAILVAYLVIFAVVVDVTGDLQLPDVGRT